MTILGLRLPVFCLFFLGFPLIWLLWIGVYSFQPGPLPQESTIDVVIPDHSSISEIEHLLTEKKVVRDNRRFSMLVMLTGAAKKLRAGEYRFRGGGRPLEIINRLRKGRVLYRPVTIPEGTDTGKIADILASEGWINRTRFIELAHDAQFMHQLGVSADSLEGYLFPDTYYLSRGQQDEKKILKMMVARHFEVYDQLEAGADYQDHGLSHHEIITLASIVEKETGLEDERPLVASVFLNRLKKGMRLQADPTLLYRRSDFSGPLRQSELANHTPYNTYIIKGLPPGPITNPGRAAIRAVIAPAHTDYLYFVLKDDNTHHFSKTLEEHNRAVAKYRRGKPVQ